MTSDSEARIQCSRAVNAFNMGKATWRQQWAKAMFMLADVAASEGNPRFDREFFDALGDAFLDSDNGVVPPLFERSGKKGRPPRDRLGRQKSAALAALAAFESALDGRGTGMSEAIYRRAARRFNETMSHRFVMENARVDWQQLRSAYNNRHRLPPLEREQIRSARDYAKLIQRDAVKEDPKERAYSMRLAVRDIGKPIYSKDRIL